MQKQFEDLNVIHEMESFLRESQYNTFIEDKVKLCLENRILYPINFLQEINSIEIICQEKGKIHNFYIYELSQILLHKDLNGVSIMEIHEILSKNFFKAQKLQELPRKDIYKLLSLLVLDLPADQKKMIAEKIFSKIDGDLNVLLLSQFVYKILLFRYFYNELRQIYAFQDTNKKQQVKVKDYLEFIQIMADQDFMEDSIIKVLSETVNNAFQFKFEKVCTFEQIISIFSNYYIS